MQARKFEREFKPSTLPRPYPGHLLPALSITFYGYFLKRCYFFFGGGKGGKQLSSTGVRYFFLRVRYATMRPLLQMVALFRLLRSIITCRPSQPLPPRPERRGRCEEGRGEGRKEKTPFQYSTMGGGRPCCRRATRKTREEAATYWRLFSHPEENETSKKNGGGERKRSTMNGY